MGLPTQLRTQLQIYRPVFSAQNFYALIIAAFFFVCLAALAAPPLVIITPNTTNAGRCDIFELTMTNIATYANPWEDPVITAMFTAPSGTTNKVGGFYFITNTWKLRFTPMQV